MDFPTPPLADDTAMMRCTPAMGACDFRTDSGRAPARRRVAARAAADPSRHPAWASSPFVITMTSRTPPSVLDGFCGFRLDAVALTPRVVDGEVERQRHRIAVDADLLDAVLRHDITDAVDVDDVFERGADGFLCAHESRRTMTARAHLRATARSVDARKAFPYSRASHSKETPMRHLILGGPAPSVAPSSAELLARGEKNVRVLTRSPEKAAKPPREPHPSSAISGTRPPTPAIFADFDTLFLLNLVTPAELQEGLAECQPGAPPEGEAHRNIVRPRRPEKGIQDSPLRVPRSRIEARHPTTPASPTP